MFAGNIFQIGEEKVSFQTGQIWWIDNKSFIAWLTIPPMTELLHYRFTVRMMLTTSIEKFADVYEEMKSLNVKHYHEISEHAKHGIDLN